MNIINKKLFILIFVLLIVVVNFFRIENKEIPEIFFKNDTFFQQGIRLIGDSEDKKMYFQSSFWLKEKQMPYNPTVPREYPHVALFFLAFPRFFTDNFDDYHRILSVMLSISFILIFAVNFKLLEKLNKSLTYNLLLFLPSVLYFTFNRFDIFPALLIQLSLFLFLNKKYNSSAFFIGLAFLTKWYAALIVPIYFFYLKNQNNPQKLKSFITTLSVVIFIPLAITFWWGGVFALFVPYFLHLTRSIGIGSFLSLFTTSTDTSVAAILVAIFTILQFSGLIILLFGAKYIKNHLDIINWSIFVIMLFIFFCRLYSPQWILWFLPLLILAINSSKMIYLIIGYDILNYLFYPIFFDINPYSYFVKIVTLARLIIFLLIILEIAKSFKFKNLLFAYNKKHWG